MQRSVPGYKFPEKYITVRRPYGFLTYGLLTYELLLLWASEGETMYSVCMHLYLPLSVKHASQRFSFTYCFAWWWGEWGVVSR